MNAPGAPTAPDRALVLERYVDAPPEALFQAWTRPELLRRWFAPRPWSVAHAECDLRAGGASLVVMRSPDGQEFPNRGVYLEVVENRRLVFTWTWPRTTPERESLVTIELRRAGRGTELVFTHAQHFDEAVRDGHRRGWSESFVKLETYLLRSDR